MCKDSRRRNWLHVIELQILFPLRSPRSLRLIGNANQSQFQGLNYHQRGRTGAGQRCTTRYFSLVLSVLCTLQVQPPYGILRNRDNREKPLIALLAKKMGAGGKRK